MEYYKLDPEAEGIHPLAELFPPVEWWTQPHNRTYALLQIETPADKPFRGHRKVINTLKKAVVDAHADRWAGAPEIQLQDVRVRLEAIGQIQIAWEARIGPQLEEGASILRAWLCETAKGVPKMRTPDLYRESSHLWYLVKHGPPGDGGDGLIHFFDALCDRYSTPPNFAKAQRSMLRWLLKRVDKLKSEIIVIDDERLAYEEIQNDLLLGPGIEGTDLRQKTEGEKTLGEILSFTPSLLDYAAQLYYDGGMKLRHVWKRVTREAKGLTTLPLTSFASFKDAFHKRFPGRKKGK
ncbi:MAG: hypothetical protein IH855_05625 [Bacteroidetes bacterium]|nr:hypothetical protein [Bacteroidota bacterium]